MPDTLQLKPGVHAAVDPGRAAVVEHDSGRVVTYRDLEDRSSRLAGLWRSRGLRPGDHVAVMLDNQAAYFEAAWAAQRSGLYLTPVNWHLGTEEAAYVIADCEARALVSTARFAPVLGQLGDALARVDVRLVADGAVEGWEPLETAVASAAPLEAADEVEGAWMFYSSGTTGRPKGILPPLALAAYGTGGALDALVGALFGFREGMTYLCPAPLYHAAPLAWSMSVHRVGGTVVLLDKFDAAAVLDAVERHRVTHAQFVPTHFVRMLKLPDEVRAAADLSSLEMVVHAAAPCPPDVKEAMLDWLGPIVHEYYSGSEGAGFCYAGPEDWRTHRGTVGRPILGTPHIVGPDGDELPVGATGQLWFETPATFTYHGDPAKTREAIDDRGWVTMGDIGHLDEDGFVYLTDRVSHTVISGGVNIYPREIEDVLVGHPHVADVAVIGVPDDEMGERLLAIVEPVAGAAPGADLVAALQAHCREHLAGFKCPREITFVDTLPRLPTGKVRKSVLRERYGSWSGAVSADADR